MNRFAEAEESYRRAAAIDPAYASPWNNLGVVFDKLGQQRPSWTRLLLMPGFLTFENQVRAKDMPHQVNSLLNAGSIKRFAL